MRPSIRTFTGDFFGAFADTAILLPILSLLALKAGFSLPLLLVSSGVLYLATGLLFRSPMPVQPLKSVAISALALGAGNHEILAATLILGAFFFLMFLFGRNLLRLPEESIRCVQWGLGLLLILQGAQIAGSPGLGLTLLLAAALLILERKSAWPWLGLFAFVTFLFTDASAGIEIPAVLPDGLRWPIIASLVLPQLALTSANSILGTELAFKEYFPDREPSLLRPRLLFSIGAGNLLMGLIGGLPFCHGSGGLTAHYRAGARTAIMNLVMGSALIWLGFRSFRGIPLGSLPAIPCAAILLTVGGLHLGLARSLFAPRSGKALLLVATAITLVSRNLLFTLLGTLLFRLLLSARRAREAPQ